MVRVSAVTLLATAQAKVAPNILIILTDDQGWGDLDYNCDNTTAMCATTPHLRALATSPGSTYFHRFYAAAGVCSPTRASILTGRTHQRDCLNFALSCDQEDPAATCAAGNVGALPTNEFTIADAAKASKLGDYQTIQMGKWHRKFCATAGARSNFEMFGARSDKPYRTLTPFFSR
jgi:arylsulfatase A-like enzyme